MSRHFSKLIFVVVLIAGLFLFFGKAGYCSDEALIEEAAQKAITQAAASFEKSEKLTGVQNIAVYPLEKGKDATTGEAVYDNAMTDLVSIALSKTKYHVILRQELLKIMEDHGFVLGKVDLFNPETVKKLGGFLGVDALVFGDVKEATVDERGATVRLNLKMAKVETGEMVGEAVTGTVPKPAVPLGPPKPLLETETARNIIRLVILVLIIIAVILLVKRFGTRIVPGYDYRQKESRLRTDRAVRTKVVTELSKAIDTLRDAREIAHKNNNADVVNKLKDVSQSIDSLRLEIDNAEYGNSQFFVKPVVKTDALERMVDFDRMIDALVKDVTAGSREIYDDTSASKMGEVSTKTQQLQKNISQLRNKFKDRRDYLRGLA